MEVHSSETYQTFLLRNFARLKVLVFLSDSIESSTAFEGVLRANLGQFEDAGVAVALVKDDFEGCEDVFGEFGVEVVPASVVLNANFSPIERLTAVAPGELLAKALKHQKTFQQSLELEELKYKQTLNRVFNDSIFILFEFLKDRNPDYAAARALCEERKFPVRRQSTAPFKEARIPVILAHLGKYFHGDYAHFAANKAPLVYFHKGLVDSLDGLEALVAEKKAVIEGLRQTEERNVASILEHNKVILFVNSDDANYGEQQAVLEGLQKKKVMFTYLDVATKPGIVGTLKRLLDRETLQLAALVVERKRVIEHPQLLQAMQQGFEGLLDKQFIMESADDRIRLILDSAPVVLFIKGTPEFPQCGFTRQIVELMTKQGVKFGYYNILADAELRERLRVFSGWETYPQVFVKGELVGGLDICRELLENGDFKATFQGGLA